MKKYFAIISTIGVIIHAPQSHAREFAPDGTNNCSAYESIGLIRPCPALSNGTAQIVLGSDVNSVKSCTSCQSGYTITSKNITDCGTTYNYKTCLINCSSNCGDNTTDWSTHSRGYETRVYEYCSSATTCRKTTQYRCAAGYYGSSLDGTSGCTACPDRILGATTTPATGGAGVVNRTFISDCHFPPNKNINDLLEGTYQYTEPCYYSEDQTIIS